MLGSENTNTSEGGASEVIETSGDSRTGNNCSSVRTPDNVAIVTYANQTNTTPAPQSVPWSVLVHSLITHERTPCTMATCQGKKCPHKNGMLWSPVVIGGAPP